MIPPFTEQGLLPPGVHRATWREFVGRFGTTPHRRRLLAGLKAALKSLRAAGCRTVYIDGSFVTAKPHPADFDGCWEIDGVEPERLDSVLLTFDAGIDTAPVWSPDGAQIVFSSNRAGNHDLYVKDSGARGRKNYS